MTSSPFASPLIASLILVSTTHAGIIDKTVITDLVDRPSIPGYNVVRPLGVTITDDAAVYMVGTMKFDTMELVSSFIEANIGNTEFIAGFGNGFGLNQIVIAQNGTRANTSSFFEVDVPVRFVVKFDQTTGDTKLWVNPDLATTEALNNPAATANIPPIRNSTFSSVVFRGGDFNGTGSTVDYTDFAVYYGGDTPFASQPQVAPTLVGFNYDRATGAASVSIKGQPSTAYRLSEAGDLDFASPDQNPLPLTSATVGTLNGNQVTTNENGDATVQFNLGTAKPTSFIRAESVPNP